MEIPGFLTKSYDNYFFDVANDWEEKAVECNDRGEHFKSWSLSTAARLPYLANAIIDVVAIPLAAIGVLFGSVPALFTWGKETTILNFSGNKLLEKVNHFCISLFGGVISPWVAYQGKEENIVFGFIAVIATIADAFSQRTIIILPFK